MGLRKRRAALLDCRAYRLDCSRKVALLNQHAAKLELSVGVVAVPLFQCLAKGAGRLFQIASAREHDPQIVPRFWELTVALLDRPVKRVDGFIEIPAPE